MINDMKRWGDDD